MGISDLAWIACSDHAYSAYSLLQIQFPHSLDRGKGRREGHSGRLSTCIQMLRINVRILVVCANDRITWSDIELASHSRIRWNRWCRTETASHNSRHLLQIADLCTCTTLSYRSTCHCLSSLRIHYNWCFCDTYELQTIDVLVKASQVHLPWELKVPPCREGPSHCLT